MSEKTALVTGGNRGIGLELCRQLTDAGYSVFLAARTLENATKAAHGLRKVIPIAMDVNSAASVAQASIEVASKTKQLHILVNNAGIYLGKDGQNGIDASPEEVEKSFRTNTLGPFLTCQAFAPLLEKAGGSQILNISSQMGQLSTMAGGHLGYRVSKTALNAMTCVLAKDLAERKIAVNCLCPGWVKTDMGGKGAQLEVSASVELIVGFMLQKQVPTGKYIQFGKELNW